MERTKTHIRTTVDAEIWDQFKGLAKFLKKEIHDLLNEAMKDRIENEKSKGK